MQAQVAVDDGEGSESDSEPDEAQPAPQPGEIALENGKAEPVAPRVEPPSDMETEPEQTAHDTPADSDAEPAQPQKGSRPPAVISVLADCTEEGSPKDALAIEQSLDQHTNGAVWSGPAEDDDNLPLAGGDPAASHEPAELASSPLAEHVSMTAPQAAPQPEQPAEAASEEVVESVLAGVVQQVACSNGESIGPDVGAAQASSALLENVAPESVQRPEDSAQSPKRERRPSAKGAEVPTVPRSPSRPGSPAQPAPQAPALRRRPARSRRPWKEGTYIGSALWLMCYCARHRRTLEGSGGAAAVVSMTTGQGLQDALSPQPKARPTPAKRQQRAADSAQQQQQQPPQATTVVGKPHGAV